MKRMRSMNARQSPKLVSRNKMQRNKNVVKIMITMNSMTIMILRPTSSVIDERKGIEIEDRVKQDDLLTMNVMNL